MTLLCHLKTVSPLITTAVTPHSSFLMAMKQPLICEVTAASIALFAVSSYRPIQLADLMPSFSRLLFDASHD